jgi:hypothetical protein
MTKNKLIKQRFVDILKTVEVGGRPYLKSIRPFEKEPKNLPALRFTYRPHSQGQLSTSGLFGGVTETGVWNFDYSWVWELFIPISGGMDVAQEEFEEFDVNMGLAFMQNPTLGDLVPLGVNIEGRQDPVLFDEQNRRYLLVQYTFMASAEEGE